MRQDFNACLHACRTIFFAALFENRCCVFPNTSAEMTWLRTRVQDAGCFLAGCRAAANAAAFFRLRIQKLVLFFDYTDR